MQQQRGDEGKNSERRLYSLLYLWAPRLLRGETSEMVPMTYSWSGGVTLIVCEC